MLSVAPQLIFCWVEKRFRLVLAPPPPPCRPLTTPNEKGTLPVCLFKKKYSIRRSRRLFKSFPDIWILTTHLVTSWSILMRFRNFLLIFFSFFSNCYWTLFLLTIIKPLQVSLDAECVFRRERANSSLWIHSESLRVVRVSAVAATSSVLSLPSQYF